MQTINATGGIRVLDTRTTATLLSKVLWITTVGFLFTAFGAYIGPDTVGLGSFGLVILFFGLLFAIRYAAQRSTTLGLALFYLFTVVAGAYVGPVIKMYLHLANGSTIVLEAALTTALGMAVMAMIAQIAQFNYQKVGAYAGAALLGLIIVSFIAMFFHFMGPAAYSLYCWGGLAIFSVLLLVDFMRLRDTPANSSPVFLALSIYLDALNIFMFLLQIFGNGSGNRRNGRWS
jgi:FtsH-binding integral membrane protein